MHGFEIIGVAINGEIALKMYQSFEEKPDIIIMDYRMPIKDGIEVMKEIFDLNIEASPNILFASADNSVKQKALKNGARGFIEKPFGINTLIDKIKKILASSPFIS